MRDGYVEVPITSRAAQAELERQEARRRAALLAATGSVPGGTDTNSSDLIANESGSERVSDAPTPMDS